MMPGQEHDDIVEELMDEIPVMGAYDDFPEAVKSAVIPHTFFFASENAIYMVSVVELMKVSPEGTENARR